MRKIKIKVGGEKLDCDNSVMRKKQITLRIDSTNERLDKGLALVAWAEAFDKLAMEFVYKPTVEVGGQTYSPDFYLKNSDVFVIVSDFKAADAPEIFCNIEANKLAHATERDVVVCYADGRLRLADYYDYKDLFERGEVEKGADIMLEKEIFLCACGNCEEWYFCTNYSWWGCRNCRHYDGDNTMAYLHLGYDSIFDLTANLQNSKIMPYKNKRRKTISVRELVYDKQE